MAGGLPNIVKRCQTYLHLTLNKQIQSIYRRIAERTVAN